MVSTFFFFKHSHTLNASNLIMYAAKQADGQREKLLITLNCTFGWMWPYLFDSSIFSSFNSFRSSFQQWPLLLQRLLFPLALKIHCQACQSAQPRPPCPVNCRQVFFSVCAPFHSHTCIYSDMLSSYMTGILLMWYFCAWTDTFMHILYLFCVFIWHVNVLPSPPGLPTVPLLPSSTSPSFSPLTPLNPAATSFNPATTLPGGWFLKHTHAKHTSSVSWVGKLSTTNIWKGPWVAEVLQIFLYRFLSVCVQTFPGKKKKIWKEKVCINRICQYQVLVNVHKLKLVHL